jgi:rubrerythrin
VVVALVLIPVGAIGFLGALAFRRMTSLVYRCRRCQREFYRAAHRPFPARCPLCRAHDWNT